jgi:lon-related putative ATP-dependent protease
MTADNKKLIQAAQKARGAIASTEGADRLQVEKLWRPTTIQHMKFKTTKELEAFDGVIEQERAVSALRLGLSIHRKNFNIFMAGYSGTGRTTIVRNILNEVAPERATPSDWAYVNNFKLLDRPIALKFPPGNASVFRTELKAAVDDLVTRIPSAFHSKEHQQRIQRAINDSVSTENESFAVLCEAALEMDFVIRATKTGLVTLPIVDEEVLSTKELGEISASKRKKVERNRKKVEPLISAYLEDSRIIQLETHEKVESLQNGLGVAVVKAPFKRLKKEWKENAAACTYLDSVENDITEHLGGFLTDETETDIHHAAKEEIASRYAVNVVVDHGESKGAPIVFENHPTFFRLFGKVEKRVEQGVLASDVTMIRAGSILQANGGYLILNSADIFSHPLVWETLKAVLRNREVTIEDMAEQAAYVPTSGLRPAAIPIKLKIILIGPPHHYDLLFRGDPDFRKLFQVKVDFDSEIERDRTTEMEVARFVATTCRNAKLKAVTRDGVATIVEEASRVVGDQDRLTLRFNEIANLLIESDYMARTSRGKTIDRKHIQAAIAAKEERSSLIERKMLDAIMQGQVLIDTDGDEAGQVNGLAVLDLGDYEFGKPARITATTFAGRDGIISVERESLLSGSIHDKGVLILNGWLGRKYAQDGPLSLTVIVTLEQSYGMIDGDSASSTELYAVVSSLSKVPIRQDLAVTGSVNQMGQIQPVGGINQKIEGFFQVCEKRGLTGKQGVLIPVQNVRHLMLRPVVREAVARGRFHIYPVSNVDQGLELLTGMPAAAIHGMAKKNLAMFQELSRKYRLG